MSGSVLLSFHGVLFLVILSQLISLRCLATQLMSSSGDGAACPNDPVVFTCTVERPSLLWRLHSESPNRADTELIILSSDGIGTLPPSRVEGFVFQVAITAVSSDSLTSTLTTLTENVSSLNGTIVSCVADQTESLTIIVAEPPSPPSTAMVVGAQSMTTFSAINLTWSPPSSTGGVSVNYVLTISPPPLSESPVTVDTTSTQITVSYNTPYNVTIRAVNCAGMSSDTMATIPSIVACPSDPPPANRVSLSDTPPPPALLGSTLSFTCNGQTVSATCESDGRWSPNPSTYECLPLNCTVPDEPCSGSIVYVVDGAIMNYESLDETVEETTVLTYQCDSGLTITCTNAGVWSTDPREIMCVTVQSTTTEPAPTAAPLFTGATVAISVVISSSLTLVIGFLAGLLVMHLCSRKKAMYSPTAEGQASVGPTAPAGPVYEEVSHKEEIKLNTNKAYGPVGL